MLPMILLNDESTLQLVNIAAMAGATCLWLFVVGACVGSFLNVVIYRVPLGISLSKNGSACPLCGAPIRKTDNIPLLGWCRLRGRCRSCKAPISIRYPLVELWIAVIFLGLVAVELISGGANLPIREPEVYIGVVWTIWMARYPDLIAITVTHITLLSSAVVLTWMGIDRTRLPARWGWSMLLISFLSVACEPRLHPLLGLGHSPSQTWLLPTLLAEPEGLPLLPTLSLVDRIDGWISLLLGCLAAVPFAGALFWCAKQSESALPNSDARNIVWLAAGTAVLLGWQTTVGVWLLTAMIALMLALIPYTARLPGLWTFSLTMALHLQLVGWRWSTSQPWWPGQWRSLGTWGLLLVVAGGLSLAAVLTLARRKHPESTDPPDAPMPESQLRPADLPDSFAAQTTETPV